MVPLFWSNKVFAPWPLYLSLGFLFKVTELKLKAIFLKLDEFTSLKFHPWACVTAFTSVDRVRVMGFEYFNEVELHWIDIPLWYICNG